MDLTSPAVSNKWNSHVHIHSALTNIVFYFTDIVQVVGTFWTNIESALLHFSHSKLRLMLQPLLSVLLPHRGRGGSFQSVISRMFLIAGSNFDYVMQSVELLEL